jgi:lipoprotein-anchoring transpeptidase ErfK/SrfK
LSLGSLAGQDETQGSIKAGSETAVIASTNFSPTDSPTQTATSEPILTTIPTSTAEPTVVEGAEETAELPQRADMIQPKNISSSKSEPMPTWTATPRPTETPTPSPTPYPTFVSSPSDAASGRPFGLSVGEKWIDVNISSQSLVAYEGEVPVFDSLVSTGTNQHPTVTGQFRIWLRLQSQDMDGYRLGYDYFLRNVPYVQYFYYDYSLHGTFWHSNFGNQMSHGCVNLPTPAAEWLFNWAEYGTLVNIHY